MSLLSWILLFLFIISFGSVFINPKFRTKYHIGLVALLLCGLLFSNLNEGSFDWKLGDLQIGMKKGGKDTTDFRLKNTSDKSISKTIRVESNSKIEKVSISKGEGYLTIVDGGIGNNYIVYNVTIPPNQVATGSVVSANTVAMFPINPMLNSRSLKEHPTNKQ